jgi:hypothetical protein
MDELHDRPRSKEPINGGSSAYALHLCRVAGSDSENEQASIENDGSTAIAKIVGRCDEIV